jgi:cardiolipin synthase (CMP-forming)
MPRPSLTALGSGHRFAVMNPPATLLRSIVRHAAGFFAAQCAVLAGVTAAYEMPWARCLQFVAVSAVFHALLGGFLAARRADFRLETTGAPLARVNLSNTLTIGRLSSIPTLLFLVLQASEFPGSLPTAAVPLAALVFVTDMLDGIIARRRGEITFVGRYLDSVSDYLMIIGLSVAFFVYDAIPLWFFVLLMARLVLFAAGMAVLALRDGRSNPLATFLGKVSIFAVMVLYVLEIAGLLGIPWIGDDRVITIVEYVVAAVIVVSFVDKVVFLARMFAAPREPGRSPRPRRSAP